jgi:acyl dehydratase
MPVRADILGWEQQVTHHVTARWALAYNAALGLTGASWLDDAAPGGPAIPGPFCVCLEWALVGADARAERCGLTPSERLRNVHASQDSRFHAAMRAGMRVTTTSRIAQIRATSAGAFLLTRLESREAETGDLLTTSWSGAILRGLEFDVPATSMVPEDAPAPPDDIAPAALAGAPIDIAIGRGQPHLYSEAARIWNPIHTERRAALAAGLPDIILHGTITWALAGLALAGDAKLRRLAASFRAPVIPGDSFTLHHDATPEATHFAAVAKGGAVALTRGLAAFD